MTRWAWSEQPGRLLASRPLLALDTSRVPYAVQDGLCENEGLECVRASGQTASLFWPTRTSAEIELHRLGSITVASSVVGPAEADALLGGRRRTWSAFAEICDGLGRPAASMLRADDGSVFIPFDPNKAASNLLSESYVSAHTGTLVALARRSYYRVRPLLPRRVQLRLRRRYLAVQERSTFPAWPAETSFHELLDLIRALIEEVAGEPQPTIASWPNGHEWSVVLTHDVERAAGYAHLDPVLEVERRHGVRSAWYFVPERDYRVEPERVRALAAEGFEVCVHGLHHDGRDVEPGSFQRRLPAMRAHAAAWRAQGFRAPATQRAWELISELGFDHDSSYSDVARYEPQPGGSCSWLPFFVGDVVELPITMPMDHTLFELLDDVTERRWLEKAALLRSRGGMALLLTHPDYLLDPERLSVYERFLDTLQGDMAAWRALPRDVSSWWRRRAASTIERDGDTWSVVGPAAAEARIVIGAAHGAE